jgi:hypothetical protein
MQNMPTPPNKQPKSAPPAMLALRGIRALRPVVMRTTTIVTLVTVLLCACGEPYRNEGRIYSDAAIKAIENYRAQSPTNQPIEQPYWNDCGYEFTCLYLYNTKDQNLVQAITANLIAAKTEVKKPGIKLTVYSSSHGEPKVVFSRNHN